MSKPMKLVELKRILVPGFKLRLVLSPAGKCNKARVVKGVDYRGAHLTGDDISSSLLPWPLARELRGTRKGFEILSGKKADKKKVELRYEWVDKPAGKPVERFWVGCKPGAGRELFKAVELPTSIAYPQYYGTIGPFKTKRGAEFMRDYGAENPHCQSVEDAEKLAKLGTRIVFD